MRGGGDPPQAQDREAAVRCPRLQAATDFTRTPEKLAGGRAAPLVLSKPRAAHPPQAPGPLCSFRILGANGRGVLIAEGPGKWQWPPEQ